MLMSDNSPRSSQILFPLIAGVGLGMLFHAPYQVFTRALRRQEVASGTSAFFLVRFTGATVGLVSLHDFPSRLSAQNVRHRSHMIISVGRGGCRVSGTANEHAAHRRRCVDSSRIS